MSDPTPPRQGYRIVQSPYYKPAQFALARRYTDLTNAFIDMGEGVLLGDDERIIAFHEKHLRFVEALANRAQPEQARP